VFSSTSARKAAQRLICSIPSALKLGQMRGLQPQAFAQPARTAARIEWASNCAPGQLRGLERGPNHHGFLSRFGSSATGSTTRSPADGRRRYPADGPVDRADSRRRVKALLVLHRRGHNAGRALGVCRFRAGARRLPRNASERRCDVASVAGVGLDPRFGSVHAVGGRIGTERRLGVVCRADGIHRAPSVQFHSLVRIGNALATQTASRGQSPRRRTPRPAPWAPGLGRYAPPRRWTRPQRADYGSRTMYRRLSSTTGTGPSGSRIRIAVVLPAGRPRQTLAPDRQRADVRRGRAQIRQGRQIGIAPAPNRFDQTRGWIRHRPTLTGKGITITDAIFQQPRAADPRSPQALRPHWPLDAPPEEQIPAFSPSSSRLPSWAPTRRGGLTPMSLRPFASAAHGPLAPMHRRVRVAFSKISMAAGLLTLSRRRPVLM